MQCDINSFRIAVNRKVDVAARQLGYDFEFSQYTKSAAYQKATDTNQLLGFIGVYPAQNSSGSWSIFKQLSSIEKQAGIEYDLQARLEREGQNAEEQLFQLEIDKNRKSINIKLEKFIKGMLEKLGVSVKNLDEFKLRYKEKTGKDISLVSVADIFENIIYVAKDERDGTTLSEEAMHFIVDIFWDNPLVKDILNLSSDGVNPDYQQTEIYKETQVKYSKLYKGDQEKINKEVIAKLLARTIYDQYYKQSKFVKALTALERILRLFLGRIFRNIRLTREIDPQGITDQLNDLLDRKTTEMRTDGFQSSLSTRLKTEGNVLVPESNFSEKAVRQLIKYLTSRKKAYLEEKTGLYDEILKNRASELTELLGSKKLQEYIDLLNDLKSNPNPTPVEQERINDLKEIINLIKMDARDKANIARIEKIDKSIKVLNNQVKNHNFEAGIFMFFFGQDGTGEGGAIEDIDAVMDAIDRIKNPNPEKPIVFDLELYAKIVQSSSIYGPMIKTLNDLYIHGFNFPELSAENNEKLKTTLSTLKVDKIDNIERFLVSQTTNQLKNLFEEYQEINPQLKYRMKDEVIKLYNSGVLAYAWGAAQNAKEDTLGIFNKMIFDIQNKIHRLTNEAGIELTNKLKGLKVNYKDLMRGHYWLNPYDIEKWEEARIKAYDDIIKKTEAFSKAKGFNVKIPKDSELRDELFAAASYENTETVSPYQAHIKKLHAYYNRQWKAWFDKNTQVHPDLENIIKRKQNSMNITQFEFWKSKNIKTSSYLTEDGELVEDTYYTGELSVPSNGKNGTNDYTDPAFEKLRTEKPDAFAALSILKEQYTKALEKVPGYMSYEIMNRLPQISQTISDIAYRGFRDVKGIGDKITDPFLDKVDDPLHADREDIFGTEQIVERPAIRYISKLEHPETISADLMRTTILFTEMANNYTEFMAKLPELNGIIEVVRRSDRVEASGTGFFSKDYLLDKFIQLKRKHIQGQAFDSKNRRLTKILQTLRQYIVARNLKGNMVSVMVGYISGQIESWIEKLLGIHVNRDTSAFKHFVKEAPQMLLDFSSPIKKSKAAVIMQDMGLIDSIEYLFEHTNENAVVRSVGKLLDWGAWRLADLALKGEAMVNVASDLRFIDKKMYSKNQWEKYIKENPSRTMAEYESAKSMYDSITVVDGKVKYEDYVKREDIDKFIGKVKVLSSRLDSQPLNIDKAAAASNLFAQFTTTHTGWLFQMAERGFKKEHFNYLTQETEIGWWKAVQTTGIWNPAKWMHIRQVYADSNPQEQEAIKRIMLMSAALSLTFAAAYILAGASLGDDEGEDSALQYAAYVTSRALMEQEARLSVSDVLRYLQSPLAGLESIDDYFTIMAIPLRLMGDDSDLIDQGIYAGYTQTQRDIIKSIPMVKGYFETLYGGYINEALGKPSVNIGVSLKDKNDFIKNRIINQSTGYSPLSFPLGLPVKAVTKFTIAQPMATALTEYPKSTGPVNLPTKKANN